MPKAIPKISITTKELQNTHKMNPKSASQNQHKEGCTGKVSYHQQDTLNCIYLYIEHWEIICLQKLVAQHKHTGGIAEKYEDMTRRKQSKEDIYTWKMTEELQKGKAMNYG
jgi:hypothetical protein